MPAPNLVSYLEQMDALRRMNPRMSAPASWRYGSAEEFLLKKGRAYESAPLMFEELEILRWALNAHGRQCKIQECYYNAALVAMADPAEALIYTEGFTISRRAPTPIQHAWLTINGKVIDPTIRVGKQKKVKRTFFKDRVVGVFPEDTEFFGVAFPTDYVRRFLVETEHAGSLIYDFKRNFPLIEGRLSI